jgi:hypothetical protein
MAHVEEFEDLGMNAAARSRIDEHRERLRASKQAIIPDSELGALFKKATETYGATCLWNCTPSPSPEGLILIAERLMKYGDLRAWQLASQIIEALKGATRLPSV